MLHSPTFERSEHMQLLEQSRVRLDPEKEYIGLMARSVSEVLTPNTIKVPLSTGEVFFANGHVQRIPRGEVEARFVPRRGTVNLTEITPPVPARVPMRSFRVPKGVGAVLVIDYVQFLTQLQASEEFFNAIGRMVIQRRIATAQQDVDMAQDALTSIQLDPQAVGARLRAASMVKTARRAGTKTTRIRGWSRT